MSAVATLAGSFALLRFDGTASIQPVGPEPWPGTSAILREPGHSTLVVFVHPFCPCTQATLNELERVLADRHDTVQTSVRIMFARPDRDPGWRPGSMWLQAALLPGATVAWDENGIEAKRFGARASGTVLLYDARGRPLFRGGITASRGHEGENVHLSDFTEALYSGKAATTPAPVFGCSLTFAEPDGAAR